jgi:hypothetical protein
MLHFFILAAAAALAVRVDRARLLLAVMQPQIPSREPQSLTLVVAEEQTQVVVGLMQAGQQARLSRVLLELPTSVAAAVVVDFVGILFRRFRADVLAVAGW